MASRSKCAQFIAWLEIVFMPSFFAMDFLFALFTFPILETLQAFGIENEKLQQWYEEIINQIGSAFDYKFELDHQWAKKSFFLLMLNLIGIMYAILPNIKLDKCIRRRESIGPFLFGINVISIAVSYSTL